MKKFLKGILHFISNVLVKIKNIFKINEVLKEESYYPNKKRKSYLKRYCENFLWIMKNIELNKFYNLYGFDIESEIKQNEYLDYRTFMKQRNQKNGLYDTYSYICFLRDKLLFEKYLNSKSIPTAHTIAIIKNGLFYDSNLQNRVNEVELFNNRNLFIKPLADECGKGIYSISNYDEYKKIEEVFNQGTFIIQEKISQHEIMESLNSSSINTLRIITIHNNDDSISVFGILLRVGTKKSGCVDNSSQGGIVVPVSVSGKLNEFGFQKPGYGGITNIHPDSKTVFSDFKIPYFDEAISLVKKAHEALYTIHSIGWDVAITPSGPILIEGNDNWEIQSIQAIAGLKNEWKKYL